MALVDGDMLYQPRTACSWQLLDHILMLMSILQISSEAHGNFEFIFLRSHGNFKTLSFLKHKKTLTWQLYDFLVQPTRQISVPWQSYFLPCFILS